jgi:hypothetical protein
MEDKPGIENIYEVEPKVNKAKEKKKKRFLYISRIKNCSSHYSKRQR